MVQRFGDGRDWFFEKRFGMFVHWGLYSIPAWHEQHQWRGSVPRGEYEKLIHQFNPVKYDPHTWLDLAEETGMEYVCLTTKHHDGFCLWDTAQTDYNVMNSPYGWMSCGCWLMPVTVEASPCAFTTLSLTGITPTIRTRGAATSFPVLNQGMTPISRRIGRFSSSKCESCALATERSMDSGGT